MILFLFVGLLGMLLILFNVRRIIETIDEHNILVQRLKNAMWFQNHWLCGIVLFFMNAGLFFLTALILYGLTYFFIPFVHIFVMLFAVIGSLLLWIIIHKAWRGTKKNRLKMATVGSSFYFMLSLLFLYKSVTLKPLYPGDDTFMRAIGFNLGLVVTTVACISCLVFTGYSNKRI